MKSFSIPYGRQCISDADIQAVIAVLRSDFLTQGPTVPIFEQAVATYCRAKYAIGVNSATSALHLACLALGVKPGDAVWTSPITFVASANCVLYCGAKVDFVDIDPLTYNMSVRCLEEKLVSAQEAGCLPKVVIPVHLAGQPCDMERIHALSQRYGFKIIEDASHAVGAKYLGEPVGNGRYSDITVFSFHPVKIITSGEGGMLLTNDAQLARALKLLRSHGISVDEVGTIPQASDELWGYQQIMLGFNYRMTDIHAALGFSQMQRLDEFVGVRHTIADRYNDMLRDLPLQIPRQSPDTYSAFHLYVIRLNFQETTKTQREVFESLRQAGIGVNLHYIPVYRQPYYQNLGFGKDYCPEAELYFKSAISLPIFPTLTEAEQDYVVQALRFAVT